MADNKDTIVTLFSGLPYVTEAGFNDLPPQKVELFPEGTLVFYAKFIYPDEQNGKATVYLAPDIYSNPEKNVAICSNMQFVIGRLREYVSDDELRKEIPPPPPQPVLDETAS